MCYCVYLWFVESPISSYLEVLRDSRYSPGFTELGETNRFIIGKAHLNNDFFILDKKKKEGFHVADSSLPDLGSPLAMEGNKMIRVWNPADISRYQDMMEEEKRAWPKQIESLIKNYDPDYENPVLIVYYMKD